MDHLRVIETGDGSHSLLNTTLQETYHSTHGAVQESAHVFIEHGLKATVATHPHTAIRLLEIGFGTGLNAMLTAMEAGRSHLVIRYESWELFPLQDTIVRQLNYGTLLSDRALFDAIHLSPWEQPGEIKEGFTLYKHKGDVVHDTMTGPFDLIYYDAFAPSRQPELWSRDVLKKITDLLAPNGIWVSYCAKGQVKRDLASLGLTVETLPGPPGKKEMTRATRKPR